jgi:hypothetical protein
MASQLVGCRDGHEGHVFYRRFHSVLVKSEWHSIELVRYVLLNPVRGVCRHAATSRKAFAAFVRSAEPS